MQDRVVGVRLDVHLQILGTRESLTTEVALVRLQRDVNTNVRRDMVTLYSRSTTVAPLASQV